VPCQWLGDSGAACSDVESTRLVRRIDRNGQIAKRESEESLTGGVLIECFTQRSARLGYGPLSIAGIDGDLDKYGGADIATNGLNEGTKLRTARQSTRNVYLEDRPLLSPS